MMKKLALIVQLSLFVISVFAQNAELAVDFSRFGTPITGPSYINRSVVNNLINDIERANRSRTPEELNEAILNSIEGTPFMNIEFETGSVLTVDGSDVKGVSLRYNVYNNKMEVLQKNVLFELTNELIARVQINDRTFDYLPFKLTKKEEAGYLELIYDGDMQLYCHYSKKFKEAQPQKAMQDRPNPAEFRDLPEVYLLKKIDDSIAIGFKNKKELLNIFPNYKTELQNYIKNEKLKLNEPEDLKKLLDFYSSL